MLSCGSASNIATEWRNWKPAGLEANTLLASFVPATSTDPRPASAPFTIEPTSLTSRLNKYPSRPRLVSLRFYFQFLFTPETRDNPTWHRIPAPCCKRCGPAPPPPSDSWLPFPSPPSSSTDTPYCRPRRRSKVPGAVSASSAAARRSTRMPPTCSSKPPTPSRCNS